MKNQPEMAEMQDLAVYYMFSVPEPGSVTAYWVHTKKNNDNKQIIRMLVGVVKPSLLPVPIPVPVNVTHLTAKYCISGCFFHLTYFNKILYSVDVGKISQKLNNRRALNANFMWKFNKMTANQLENLVL